MSQYKIFQYMSSILYTLALIGYSNYIQSVFARKIQLKNSPEAIYEIPIRLILIFIKYSRLPF